MKEILTTSGTALKDQNKESLPTIKSNWSFFKGLTFCELSPDNYLLG
jgi:hypothetical protein